MTPRRQLRRFRNQSSDDRFFFFLAEKMNRPDVAEMLDELSPRTLMYWRAYYTVLAEERQRAQSKK